MLEDLALWVVAFAVGAALQRRDDAPRLSRVSWSIYFATVTPAVVLFAYSTVVVSRQLVASLLLVVVASWAVLGLGLGYGRIVGRSRAERGALALCAGWGNTATLGYPLAQLVYGPAGLVLQALYVQFAFGIPAVAVSATVARAHGTTDAARARVSAATLLRNPPLLAAIVAIALRLGGVHVAGLVTPLGRAGGWLSGPFGFLQLGLAMPLQRVAHGGGDLLRAGGVLVLRHGVAPALLFGLGLLVGVDVPDVFVLAAAGPVAFHLVTLAAVFGVRPTIVRLLVVTSTLGMVASLTVWAAFLR